MPTANDFILMSETVAEIGGALAKAQATMKDAEINAENPHFKSDYADLESVREAIIGPLNANGIALSQIPTLTNEGSFELITMMIHSPSGEYLGGRYPLPGGGRPQELGSAITYARRYVASAIAFIASKDDDGNAAQAAPVVPRTPSPPLAPAAAPVEWSEPETLVFKTNYVEWGARLAERIRAAKTSGEVNQWVVKNHDTFNTSADKAPRVHARLVKLIDDTLAGFNENKTDARATPAKSAVLEPA